MHNTEETSDRASIDNDGTSLFKSNEKARKSQTGYEWRNGASICLHAAAAILFLNILLTIIAASRAQQSSQSFEAETIFEGSCAKAKRWSTGFHILINVLGTILLGASNYCMQCLNAPSRKDVDRAHAHGKWLDIGTPSVTNLRVMSWVQIIIWFLLVLTSLPFHVLYNAAVFSALSSNAYGVVAVPPDGRIGSANSTTGACYKDLMGKDVGQVQMMYQEKELEFLSKEDCIKTYGVAFLSNRRTLLLVTNNNSVSSPGLLVGIGSLPAPVNDNQNPFDWMCSGPRSDLHGDFGSGTTQCLQSALLKHANDWSVSAEPFSYSDIVVTGTDFAFTGWNYTELQYSSSPPLDIMALGAFLRLKAPFNTVNDTLEFIQSQSWNNPSFKSQLNVYMSDSLCATYSRTLPVLSPQYYSVDYCLSEKVEERCRVMYSPAICLLVIVCNAIKVVCILFTIRLRRKELLFTVGDAIASFMEYPDRTTLGRCWVERKKAKSVFAKPRPVASRMLPPRRRWHHAVGRTRWILSVTWCLVCLTFGGAIVTTIAYNSVVNYLPNARISTVWSLGFSEARPETMLRSLATYNLIAMVLLSNTPQVILSSLYYLINSILTCMLASAEYTSYSVRRQYLRVSWPEGQQRSTYFLSLPYTFSIPTMVISAILHWLLSESIFYVRIYQYDAAGTLDETNTISTCGISPIAMIFTLSLAGLALVVLAGLGFKRFPTKMPLAGNCSLAISAACHPPLGDEDAALKPLMWGEVAISGASGRQGKVVPGEESREEPGEEGGLEEEVFRDNVELEERSLLPLVEGRGVSIYHCCFTSTEVEEPVSMKLYI